MNSKTTQRGKGRETNLSKDGDQEHASHSPPSVGGVEEGTVVCEKSGEGSELSFLPFSPSRQRVDLDSPHHLLSDPSRAMFSLNSCHSNATIAESGFCQREEEDVRSRRLRKRSTVKRKPLPTLFPWNRTRKAWASSSLPFARSHRGDSAA